MKRSGRPDKLDSIVFLVDDLERSLDFYKNILKLNVILNSPTWAEFRVGDINIALHQKTPDATHQLSSAGNNNMSIQFEVKSIEDHVAFLKLHGVEIIGGIKDSRFARYAFFTDPDGNILGYREYKQNEFETA